MNANPAVPRYKITTKTGRYLAIIPSMLGPEAAKLALIAQRGYSYYTPDNLNAELVEEK